MAADPSRARQVGLLRLDVSLSGPFLGLVCKPAEFVDAHAN